MRGIRSHTADGRGHAPEAYLRVDITGCESGLEDERSAVAKPMANARAPPLQFFRAAAPCAALGGADPRDLGHLLFVLHDPRRT